MHSDFNGLWGNASLIKMINAKDLDSVEIRVLNMMDLALLVYSKNGNDGLKTNHLNLFYCFL